ncbi:MAG TPA: ribosome small subunit-dependent GTPase A [Steroidobacteraceae bacterium]|nr:ribosome small subunit-dependent GTPase A [Steroidobacteraceae bacterium]
MNPTACNEFAARVVESFGRRVVVADAQGKREPAEMFGKRISCVCGDDVLVRAAASNNDVARVIKVEQRRSLFARTDSRGRTEPLAANLTVLAVLVAPQPEPDFFMIDRYLAGAALASVESFLLVNKADLPSDDSFSRSVGEYAAAGYTVMSISAKKLDSVVELQTRLHDQLAMLVGQSGVGKSTLTNLLAPASARQTRTLSDSTQEGRHTTVSTAMFQLPTGGELIDSPGVRDYAPPLVEDAMVQVGWKEIMAAAPNCRFNNCLHLREPGCAVTAAVAANEISPRRYESYKRLVNIMRGLAPEYERRR